MSKVSDEYQAMYDIKKAERLLNKHGILNSKQKEANEAKIVEEKNKKSKKSKKEA